MAVPPEPRPSVGDLSALGHDAHGPKAESTADFSRLALGALGVVYGDIGTSPLYAIKECFAGTHGVAPTPENVLGILSLVFWSLLLVVVAKYLTFIMRASNHGEGGILALLALLGRGRRDANVPGLGGLVLLGLFGAALLYGDGIITPAISVLSAVEGLEVATAGFKPFVVVITVGVLIGLFLMQRRGTDAVGAIFGPAMLLWFVTIAAIGLPWIIRRPEVLAAMSPHHAIGFMMHHRWHGFLVLGAVVLCITGGEALYADMGHFGRKPIRWAWYVVVFPCLLVNYFGQGALLLASRDDPPANPFYGLVSGWMLYPLVVLATVAAVVASQALISGAYSLTQQAVQLGYCPRVAIVHTSGHAEGQIFIPEINNMLMVACVTLVITLRESEKMAAAYGIAVTGTMSITSILFYFVAVHKWGWHKAAALGLTVVFMAVDLAFFTSNAAKIYLVSPHYGWFPLVIGAVVFVIMTTWKKGRDRLYAFIRESTLPLELFMADLAVHPPHRVKGTAVFMTSNPEGAPPVLLHHFKHNKVLHQQVVLLSIITAHEPEIESPDRLTRVKDLGQGFYQVTAKYGFMQTPNVLDVLTACEGAGLAIDRADTSFFLGRETLLITRRPGMSKWRKVLFAFLSRNARPANAFFRLPPNRVVELGTQIEL